MPLIGHLPADNRLAAGIVRITPDGGTAPMEALAGNLPAVEHIIANICART